MTIESKHGSGSDGEPPEPPTEVYESSPDYGDSFWARLKRALRGSAPRRIVSVVVGLLVVLVVAGGIADTLNRGSGGASGSASVSTPEVNTTETDGDTTPEASGFSGEGCTSGPADANVRVTIYGGETCAEWDRTQSASGTFWREVSFPPTSDGEELACSMEGSAGHTLIEVRDTGEHSYGNRICALLTSEGWHNAEGPGAKLEQSRKAHEAEAKANAEAQTTRENQQHQEAERPGLEAEASKLKGEAAGLRQKQHAEEAAAKHDEAEASRVSHDAEGAEGEASDKLNEESDNFNSAADTHNGNADTFRGEAEPKESEAESDSRKASED